MFNPTKLTVRWYKRNKGSYNKQIPLKVDSKFDDGEIVYVLNQDEFRKYCNPDLYDDNVELKEQLQKLQDDFDAFKLDSESIKQQMQSNHETILQELRQNLADAESKSEKLQSDINQMHQKIHEKDEKMQDISNLNTIIMQDVNRKNLELKDYQNEMESSIRNAVNETNKMANANIKKIDRIKFLFGRQNINLNIPIDDIIADNTPARKQGFFEVITTPQIANGDGDDAKNETQNDEKQD